MRKSSLTPTNLELGDFLSNLQEIVLVDGKRLCDAEICRRASLSTKTYIKVKRA